MTAEPVLEQARGHWRFENSREFSDAAGILGAWVGPRTGPDKRTHDQKERHCILRYLVANRIAAKLEFPLDLVHVADGEGPDFRLCGADGVTFGLEVTEAASQDYQAAMTEWERSGRSHRYAPSSRAVVSAWETAIKEKVSKWNHGAKYGAFGPCDLLIYDNTLYGGFLDTRDLLSGLRDCKPDLGRFRRIHVLTGGTLHIDIFGNAPATVWTENAYEIDFSNWARDQIEKLRLAKPDGVDVDNLIEELEGLVRADKRSYRAHLTVLLQHLLKWAHQPSNRSRSWGNTINAARESLEDLLEDNPSFRNPDFAEVELQKAYGRAVRNAARETGLPASRFATSCPYTQARIFDPEFFPEAAE